MAPMISSPIKASRF